MIGEISSAPTGCFPKTENANFRDLLSEVSFPKKTPDPIEKREAKAKLEEIYQALRMEPQVDLRVFAEVLTKYGRLSYEDGYPHCMVMMRASLNAQLVAQGLFNELCFELGENLESMKDSLMDHAKFKALDDFLLSSDVHALVSQMSLDSEQAFVGGYTLSWMANSLHHTDGFRPTDEAAPRRFDQVYAFAETLLQLADSNEGRLEIAELYYNGLRGVSLRKDGGNLEAAHAWLEKAKVYNGTLEFAARVANLKSCDYGPVDPQRAKAFLEEAIRIRQGIRPEDQDPFLVANLYCRATGLAIKEGKLDEAERFISKSLEHAQERREKGTDHQYYGYYNLQMAKVKFGKKEFSEATLNCHKAMETFRKHEQDSREDIGATEKLLQEIQEQSSDK